MRRRTTIPTALTIAGSDSGGGAGIQADLKTFAACHVHGTSAITCITAQNPKTVLGVQPVRPSLLLRQLEAVLDAFHPTAIKTGMLYSKSLIETVAGFLSSLKPIPVVVDPVMAATSGARLLRPEAESALRGKLLPLATVITPNLDEAEILVGRRVRSVEAMRKAARTLHDTYGSAVLVKGGHLRGGREAVDLFFDGRQELLLTAPYIPKASTHGSGCTYSAAITAGLAKGLSLPKAVMQAKERITEAIAHPWKTRGGAVLNPFQK